MKTIQFSVYIEKAFTSYTISKNNVGNKFNI